MKTTAHTTTTTEKAAKVAAIIFNTGLALFGIWYIVETLNISIPQIF